MHANTNTHTGSLSAIHHKHTHARTHTTTRTINKLFRCCDFAINIFRFSRRLLLPFYPPTVVSFSRLIKRNTRVAHFSGLKIVTNAKMFTQILKRRFLLLLLRRRWNWNWSGEQCARSPLCLLCVQRVMQRNVTTLWKVMSSESVKKFLINVNVGREEGRLRKREEEWFLLASALSFCLSLYSHDKSVWFACDDNVRFAEISNT